MAAIMSEASQFCLLLPLAFSLYAGQYRRRCGHRELADLRPKARLGERAASAFCLPSVSGPALLAGTLYPVSL